MEIIITDQSKAAEVAKLAVCLTNEITERTTTSHFGIDVPRAVKLCEDYIE